MAGPGSALLPRDAEDSKEQLTVTRGAEERREDLEEERPARGGAAATPAEEDWEERREARLAELLVEEPRACERMHGMQASMALRPHVRASQRYKTPPRSTISGRGQACRLWWSREPS